MRGRTLSGLMGGLVFAVLALVPRGAWAEEGPKALDRDAFKRILPYTFGQDAKDLNRVADMVRDSYGRPQERKEIELALLAALRSPQATFECKQFVCRQLVNAGTADSVSSLAALLPDEKLSHMALYALARIPGDEASKALCDAMGSLQAQPLVGVINAIGTRRDARATGSLLKLMSHADAAVAEAACAALGKIGGDEAAQAIAAARANASGRLRAVLDDAYLRCADRFLANGKKAQAEPIYEKLYAPAEKEHVRAAALRGLIAASGEKAIDLVMKPFTGADPALQAVAAGYIRDIPGTEATRAFAERLPKLTPEQQALMLDVLSDRGDLAAGPATLEATRSANEKVRTAALKSLARLGDESAVPVLAKAAAEAVAPEADAARYSLNLLRGPKVDEAILGCLAKADDPKMKAELIKGLTARRTAAALPALLTAAQDADGAVRQEAFKALGVLADEKTLPGLVALLTKAKEDREREALENAVRTVAGKAKSDEARTEPLLAALPAALPPAKAALLRVLGKFGGDKPLQATLAALKETDAQVKDAAFRALVEWPDAGPADPLLDLVKNAPDERHRVLALRGYVRLIALPSDRSVGEVLKRFDDAMGMATRADEKKLVLSAIADVVHPDTLKLLEPYLADAALKAEAVAAAKKVRDALSGPPKVTASVNAEKAGNAIDGKAETRWDTGQAMQGGEWFMLQLPMEREVSKIVLDSKGSGGDYPRGYEVHLSRDGKNWGAPVAKGEGRQAVVEIAFRPAFARFIRIVQTGKANGLFWSIHELKIEAK